MNRGTIKVPQLDKKIVVGVEGTYKNGKILYIISLKGIYIVNEENIIDYIKKRWIL